MKLNLYLIQPELRYWPCRKFEGHFLGVHGHYAYYNVGPVSYTHLFRTDKKIAEATAYICGLGFYEFTLNGKKVGDSEFAPLDVYKRQV